jgi:hypothetical protein
MTAPLRPGATAWRIGPRTAGPMRCVVIKVRGDLVDVRSSTLSRAPVTPLPAADVFATIAECRVEIQRRAALEKPATPALPAGVTRGMPPVRK